MKTQKVNITLGREPLLDDIHRLRVTDTFFDFDKELIHLKVSVGYGGTEKKTNLTITFENAQRIGLINLNVLLPFLKNFK